MLGHRGVEKLAAMVLQCGERASFIRLHQAAVTHHIGDEYGCKATVHHAASPPHAGQ